KPARRRAEPLLLVFAVPGFERHTHRPSRRIPQHHGRYAARREVVRECRLDISTPETISEPQANRQIEHHIDVRPSFTARWHDRRPKLEVLASSLVEAEADAQTFSFPPAGDREHDICV